VLSVLDVLAVASHLHIVSVLKKLFGGGFFNDLIDLKVDVDFDFLVAFVVVLFFDLADTDALDLDLRPSPPPSSSVTVQKELMDVSAKHVQNVVEWTFHGLLLSRLLTVSACFFRALLMALWHTARV